MAVTHGYISLDALKVAINDPGDARDDDYDRVIAAASRQIDTWYGGQFWREPTPVARLFRAEDYEVLWAGEFATTTGLVVETDDDEDGTFETVWDAADWQAEPLVRSNGRPFDRIVAVGDLEFPVGCRRASVRVTAAWGWPAVPAEVEQACLLLAVDHYKAKDLTGGVAGFADFGAVRIAAFNPQAKALLEHLRVPAVFA